MDFSLNEEQRGWLSTARKFADEEIRPITLQRDWIEDPIARFDWEVIKKGSKLGFRTAALAKKWGGHGLDLVTQVLLMAELAKADSSISKTFSQCWKWSQLIDAICTEEQKKRFLPPFVADDTYLLGSGNTEPNAGSDNRLPPDDVKAGVRLRAERHGDEWILNGEKCFIANGGVGKMFFLKARTDPNVNAKKGTTLFLFTTDTPGFRFGKTSNKDGWRFYQNAELIFENARVPHSNVVGEVNGGAEARDQMQFSDLELAGNAIGVCDAAVERAMQCVRSRKRAGVYLRDHQTILLKLTEMHMLTEALRSLALRAAWERDLAVRGDTSVRGSANVAFAMIFAQQTIQRVTQLNMDVACAVGMKMDAYADKLLRDGIIWTHLAGASVQRMKAVKGLVSR